MAKRAENKDNYRPLLDTGLVSAVLAKPVPEPQVVNADEPAPVKDTTPPMIEPSRRIERIQPEVKTQQPELQKEKPHLFEKFDQEKRILFTRGETQAIDRLVTSLAARVDTQVKVSHVMRALVALLLHAENNLDKRAGEAGELSRPANGDAQALQRFEREIAKIIAAALRDAGPLR